MVVNFRAIAGVTEHDVRSVEVLEIRSAMFGKCIGMGKCSRVIVEIAHTGVSGVRDWGVVPDGLDQGSRWSGRSVQRVWTVQTGGTLVVHNPSNFLDRPTSFWTVRTIGPDIIIKLAQKRLAYILAFRKISGSQGFQPYHSLNVSEIRFEILCIKDYSDY